ncbi:DUF550 domain-containing protein [Demequina capsici]|uniref:DUF550 domain-containing protein n=1 Tax=Demequina capsici TaxID=3075620 RepID=A0AA96FDF1_9MICO|nr:dATP/dGTP pyrophosphohydrolase domain-containing protein [Demequina sp. PMTSA13]WNM27527.1 DUF550 domain-containing protein [Demequina sp. PMTSA13]
MCAFALDAAHLYRQHGFSQVTFGPGERTAGCIDHIRKEIKEIEENPDDLSEWADGIILHFDGAMRRGFTPQQILDAILDKQRVNEGRIWPDWRTQPLDKAIEHVDYDNGEPLAEWEQELLDGARADRARVGISGDDFDEGHELNAQYERDALGTDTIEGFLDTLAPWQRRFLAEHGILPPVSAPARAITRMYDGSVAFMDGPLCLATSPVMGDGNIYVCTRTLGHPDSHETHDFKGDAASSWAAHPQGDAVSSKPAGLQGMEPTVAIFDEVQVTAPTLATDEQSIAEVFDLDDDRVVEISADTPTLQPEPEPAPVKPKRHSLGGRTQSEASKHQNEIIIAALAKGLTVSEAAELAGLTGRAASSRIKYYRLREIAQQRTAEPADQADVALSTPEAVSTPVPTAPKPAPPKPFTTTRVEPPTSHMVPAVGTRRRIFGLYAIGYDPGHFDDFEQGLGDLARRITTLDAQGEISLSDFEIIDALYSRLRLRPVPNRDGVDVDRTHPAPGRWMDRDIDDPKAVPAAETTNGK